jgi:hypothetical protein
VEAQYEYTIRPGDARRKTWVGLLLTTLSNRRLLGYSLAAILVIVVGVAALIWGDFSSKAIGVLALVGPGGLGVVLFRSAANVYRSNEEAYPVGTVLTATFEETEYLLQISSGHRLRLPYTRFRVTRSALGYVRVGSRDADDPTAAFIPRQVFPRDRVKWFNAQASVNEEQ